MRCSVLPKSVMSLLKYEWNIVGGLAASLEPNSSMQEEG